MSTVVRFLGHDMRPLESIPRVGTVLGMSKATSLRCAESDGWPLIGDKGSRLVVVPALASLLGIPYSIADEEAPDEPHD